MANKTQKFCRKGHDTEVTGRTSDGHCLPCRIEYLSLPRISKQQFCLRKHDTFITGRDKKGACKECKKLRYIPHPKMKTSLCRNGHDKDIVGRDKFGDCVECRKSIYNERVIKNRAILDSAKDKPCADCNIKYDPWVMDFDHLRDKEFTISSVYANYSEIKLLEEISKCDVVCSNCHRIRTYNRKSSLLN